MDVHELTSLARQIAPDDLNDVPVYLVLSSELPEDLRPDDSTRACTARTLDLGLKPWLSSVGRWKGRGPAIILCDAAIESDAREAAGEDHGELYRVLLDQRQLGYFLHELAHSLDTGIDQSDAPAELVEFVRIQLKSLCSQPPPVLTVPFAGHGGPWLRCLCHVVHRAEKLLGERVAWPLVFTHMSYELSCGSAYHWRLIDEVETFSGSFAELPDLDPPAAFVRLWRSDVVRWLKRQTPTKETLDLAIKHTCLFPLPNDKGVA